MIKGSEALLRALLDEGVDTLFGYPGGAIMPVYDALYDYKDRLNHILVRHEQGAVHAAQGYARVSGRVGVAMVTSGPGATNTITGIADAMVDSTPIVVICGQVSAAVLGTDAFQECDLVGITQPISKWAFQIRRPEDIAWAVSRAFYLASTGRKGPVVLDFTKNAQTHMVDYEHAAIRFIRSYVPVPATSEESVRQAAELINECHRPLVLVGQGVELAGAGEQLRGFVEKAGLPFGTTVMGLSAMPSHHPLNMGMLGMHGAYAPNVKTQQCDLLIAVGMRFSDRVTGRIDTYAKQAKVIHFEIDPCEVNKSVHADVSVMGDCRATLAAVTELLKPASHDEWVASFEEPAKLETEKVINPEIHPASGYLKMGEVIHEVSEQSNHQAVMVTDVGQNQMMACRYFKFSLPRSVVTSGGMGTMGFCLPAAIGATFGAPHRMVCAFVGDGGMQMTIQELGTIMETGAPVKIILLNNNYLGNVRQWQELFFNHRYSFTPVKNPDYNRIADAYAIPNRLVVNREDLAEAVAEMLATDGPYLLHCAVEEETEVLPMCTPGSDVDDMILELNKN